jgi:hypothetical protein
MMFQFCSIHLAFNRNYFEVVLIENIQRILGLKIHHIVTIIIRYIVVITKSIISFHSLINITKGHNQGISYYVTLGTITKQVNPKLHDAPNTSFCSIHHISNLKVLKKQSFPIHFLPASSFMRISFHFFCKASTTNLNIFFA